MKVLEFETSKGKFKLIDMPETIRINGWNGSIVIDELNQIPQEKYAKGFYLKNITEEQASEIVVKFEFCNNYKDELFTRLKSKGIHLFKNPFQYTKTDNEEISDKMAMCRFVTKEETKSFREEQKTFYNPYIFKL